MFHCSSLLATGERFRKSGSCKQTFAGSIGDPSDMYDVFLPQKCAIIALVVIFFLLVSLGSLFRMDGL